MKIVGRFAGVRRLSALPLAAVLLLLAGCLEKNLLWSPDGRRAVVFGQEGLYLTDADGRLSPLLASGAYCAAWFGDSHQLVVGRRQRVGTWEEAERLLGAERARKFAAYVEQQWQKSPAETRRRIQDPKEGDKAEPALQRLYLRDRHGSEVRSQLDAAAWADWQTAGAELHALVRAKIEGETLVFGATLYGGAAEIEDLRIAAGDRAVAFVAKNGGLQPGQAADELQLWIARFDAADAELIAAHVAAYPDWSADGRGVIYVQATGAERDQLRLGTLVQRTVFDAAGGWVAAPALHELAGVLFSDRVRVRCLRDGRILFNAAEIALPIAAEDFGDTREQLFALDPSRQATLTRLVPRKREANLPQSLAFFEVSPDEQQVLFGDFNGCVAVLTLATGEVEQVQEATKDNLQGQPVWRSAGEFSYTRRSADKGAVRKAEITLRAGGRERVLSAGWPDDMVNHLFSQKK